MSNERRIYDLPDEILVAIFSYLDVEDLALNICNVCNRWRNVAQDSRLWKSLKYSPTKGMTKEDRLIEVLKGAPNLRWPMPWYLYTRKILETISDYCKEVRELYICEADDNLVQKLVAECSNIEFLELDYYKFETTNSLNIISQCNNLKHLKLSGYGSYYDADLFKAIALGCPSLESFDIQYLTHYSSGDLVYFLRKKGSQVHALTLRCCFYCEEACVISSITNFCSELEALTIDSHGKHEAYSSENDNVWGTSNFIKYFEKSPVHKLKKLELLSFGSFDKKLAFAIFENCNNLESVCVEKIKGLTDECLEPIYQLRVLTSLKCDHCTSITDRGISHIVRCSTLKVLSLMGCDKLTNGSFIMCCSDLKLLEKLVLNVPTLNIDDVFLVPNLLKNLNYLHISRDGLEEQVPIFFRRVMPKMDLVM